mmetsp:Transcript_22479/g.25279  ORF Transcript_22479/g.25279 Transcript_22479/m.25279 type:complete len:250 (+) Transcript_22479:128-877(+)
MGWKGKLLSTKSVIFSLYSFCNLPSFARLSSPPRNTSYLIHPHVIMGNKKSKNDLFDTIFNMKLASKQLTKEAQKSRKQEGVEKQKVKKSIEQGIMENAQIHAENAIRKKNESLNYLKLASKMDAVASRIETAYRTQQVTGQMQTSVKQMQKAMNLMNFDKMEESMREFETMFENLDVQSQYVNQTLASSTASSTPQSEVNSLISQVADEHQLQVTTDMSAAGEGKLQVGQKEENKDDDIMNRLNNLKS